MLSETLNAYNSETDRDIGMNQKATRRVRSLLSFERRQNFFLFFLIIILHENIKFRSLLCLITMLHSARNTRDPFHFPFQRKSLSIIEFYVYLIYLSTGSGSRIEEKRKRYRIKSSRKGMRKRAARTVWPIRWRPRAISPVYNEIMSRMQ